jgi:carnosine N-methyltransferase
LFIPVVKRVLVRVSLNQRQTLEREVKYSQKFTDIGQLLEKNQQLCNAVVQNAMEFYGIDKQELDQHTRSMKSAGRGAERVSVSQALKHFVRDWAVSGANERDAAFPCIIQALKDLFPNPGQDGVKVLLPGAGVGRLGHEVAELPGKRLKQQPTTSLPFLCWAHKPPGFQVTNNEWSTYQNIAYRFLTSHSTNPDTSTIHPFIDSWSHHRSTADMLRPITFPNVPIDASSVLLVEGDFTTVFRDETAAYDAVVTHFFIDTARNLMSYFDTIARLVKPGGYWVNFGPLLYGTAPFVQLSLEEIVKVVEGMGFEFLEVPVVAPAGSEGGSSHSQGCGGKQAIPGKRVYGVEAVYGFDERALTRNAYEAVFWVARRK